IAFGHHVREIIINYVKLRQFDPIRGVGTGGDDQCDNGAGSHRPGPSEIEGGLHIITRHKTGIGPIKDSRESVGHSKDAVEIDYVGKIDIRPAHHRYADSASINTSVVQRVHVVDRRKVCWPERVLTARKRNLWLGVYVVDRRLVWRNHVLRLAVKTVECRNTSNSGDQGGGNLRVGRVGPMLLAAYRVLVNGRAERLLHLSRIARELDMCLALRDVVNAKTVCLQPGSNGLDVLLRRSECFSEFIWREPPVVVRGKLVLLIIQQFLQGGLLLGCALEHKQHAIHGQIGRRSADVELRAGRRMSVLLECSDSPLIYRLSNERSDGVKS